MRRRLNYTIHFDSKGYPDAHSTDHRGNIVTGVQVFFTAEEYKSLKVSAAQANLPIRHHCRNSVLKELGLPVGPPPLEIPDPVEVKPCQPCLKQ